MIELILVIILSVSLLLYVRYRNDIRKVYERIATGCSGICHGNTNAYPLGDLLNTLTPILGIISAICSLLAAATFLGWLMPGQWSIMANAMLSIVLQVIWFSSWAVLPLLVDVALWGSIRPARHPWRPARTGK